MKDFIADDDCTVLQRSGLADFEALRALDLLPAVDDLNRGRGGRSEVSGLENDEQACYRQDLYAQTRGAILGAFESLVHWLREEGLKHDCVYARHIFLRPNGRCFNACLINTLMAAYMKRSADDVALVPWLGRLSARSLNKDARA